MDEWVQPKSTSAADFDRSGLKPRLSPDRVDFNHFLTQRLPLTKAGGMILGARKPTLAGDPCRKTRLAARR
jgi:hypothetical protein